MTIGKLLTKYSSATTFNDVVLLLSHVAQKPKEFILVHPEYYLSVIIYLRFRYLLRKYLRGYPIAYLTAHKEFFGLDFIVNQHTLIPRPDTEIMVEETIQSLTTTHDNLSQTLLIDIGTGTGCIPISIIKKLKSNNVTAVATDISPGALRVAKQNAARHHTPITFFRGHLLQPILRHYKLQITNYKFIYLTANLPYLTADQFASEQSIQKEPYSALVATQGGLALYEQLLNQIHSLLSVTTEALFIFLEIDPSQSGAIILLIKRYLPSATTEIKTDLAGRDRLVKIKISPSSTTLRTL